MSDNNDFVDVSSGAQKELGGDIQEPETDVEEALQDQFEELDDGFSFSDEELQNTKKRPCDCDTHIHICGEDYQC